MEWLISLIKNNTHIALLPAAVCNLLTFGAHLAAALADGKIDSAELQGLLSSASGIELVILLVVMIVLKQKKP